MKSLLILGASGFIGKSFIDYFLNNKDNKFGISNLILVARKKAPILIKNKKKIRYLKKDLLKINKLPESEYILYCINSKSMNDEVKCFKYFDSLLKKNHKKPKIIFTSSGAVYGPNNKKNKATEKFESGDNFYEYSNYKKKYAEQKKELEKKFKKLSTQGYTVCIARLFTFSGIHIDKNEALPNLILQGLISENIHVKSKIKVYRSYMSDVNLIKTLLNLFQKIKDDFLVLNLGSDKIISLENLANIIAKITNKNLVKNYYISKKIDFYVPSIKIAKKIIKTEHNKNNIMRDIKLMIAHFKK
jgi:nucleoside-diphosphate-sugar epimerase